VPRLKGKGVTDHQLDQIMIHNPRRILSIAV
jgi:predicted metal-dependent phosphotriesterase family hydrolase